MLINSHLDWLQITFPIGFKLGRLERFAGHFEPLDYGMLGYTEGYKAPDTGVVAYTGGNEKMGTFVMMRGEPLATMRERGVTDTELCKFALDNDGKSSRIDMTINILNGPLTVGDMVSAWQDHRIKCPAHKARETKDLDVEGHTLYIGGDSSERRARCYDKLGEMRVKDPEALKAFTDITSWLRLELQARDDRAKGYQGAIATFPDASAVIKSAWREYADWNDPTYQAAITGPHVEIEELPRKLPAFWGWMTKQVIPAAVRRELEADGEDVKAIFCAMFDAQMEIERPKHKRQQGRMDDDFR